MSKLHLRHKRTNKQTDRQTNGQTPVIEFRACQPKNVTSGGNNCNDFPDNKLTKCRAFIG